MGHTVLAIERGSGECIWVPSVDLVKTRTKVVLTKRTRTKTRILPVSLRTMYKNCALKRTDKDETRGQL